MAVLDVPGKHLRNYGGFGGVHADACGVAGTLRIHAIAIGRAGPGEQLASLQLAQPTATGPLGNERALVLGHRPTDLQKQLVVGVLAHRTVEELDVAAVFLEFFEQKHLMHIVASETVRVGHQDDIELGSYGVVTQPVEAGPTQGRAAIAVIAEEVLFR